MPEVETCYTRLLLARHKMQIAMLDEEKLRDLDTHVQQEATSLSWLCTMAPAFPMNASKVN